MSEVSWRERFPEEVTCIRCLEVREVEDLDRLLWCETCRARARRRAAALGWVAGVVLAALLALWVWLRVGSSSIIPTAWIATVVATLWIGARVSREVIYGVMRFRNRKATDAVPPELGPDRGPDG